MLKRIVANCDAVLVHGRIVGKCVVMPMYVRIVANYAALSAYILECLIELLPDVL